MTTVRAACVQFQARPEKSENVALMAPLVAEAAARGADVVLLPEKWNAWMDGPRLRPLAERLDAGETVDAMAGWARDHRINLIGGSIALVGDDDAVHNVSIAFDRAGERVAAYSKMHLFDVDVGGFSYRESDGTAAGSDPVVVELDGVVSSRPTSRWSPGWPTGRCSCGRARSRTRRSCWRPASTAVRAGWTSRATATR